MVIAGGCAEQSAQLTEAGMLKTTGRKENGMMKKEKKEEFPEQ